MSKFLVRAREVHVQYYSVEAASPEEAVETVVQGGGEQLVCEYSHTMDKGTWDVEDENGSIVLDQQ